MVSFKKNWQQATIIWVFFLLFLIGEFLFITAVHGSSVILLSFLFMTVIAVITLIYSFSLISKFQNSVGIMLRNGLMLAIHNAPYSILMLLITGIICLYLPIYQKWAGILVILLGFSTVAYAQSYLMRKILVPLIMKERKMRVDIQLLIKKKTLRQKIAQMTQLVPDFFDTDESGVVTGPLASFGISKVDLAMIGSVLGSYDGETLYRLQKKHMVQDPLKIPLLFMGDVIHGLKTIFPIPLALGATFNPETVEKVAAISAIESSEAGLHVTFSPMADLVRDIRWGRVMESTGEDPYLNGLMSEAFVKGYQGTPGELLINRYKIAATLKHFAGYGAVEAGRDYTKAELSEHSLREYYLSGYKAAIDAGVELVMTAFNTVDDIPATANKHLMLDLLRGELGFKGVLISDWGAVTELIAHGVAADYKAAAKLAIEARVDIEMMTPAYLQSLEDLVTTGIVSERQIDQAVLGILTLKEKLGLFADPYRGYEQQLSNDYQFRTLSLPHRIQEDKLQKRVLYYLKMGFYH